MDSVGTILSVIGSLMLLLGALAAIWAYFRTKLGASTNDILEKNNDALVKRVEILEESDATKTTKIAALEGEIRTLKTLPLAELADSYKAMARAHTEMVATQKKIIDLLTEQRIIVRPS